jgi:hypothetical protein
MRSEKRAPLSSEAGPRSEERLGWSGLKVTMFRHGRLAFFLDDANAPNVHLRR